MFIPITPATPDPFPAAPPDDRLRYRLLTGPDDRAFCERVSAALAEGYRLSGGPAVTFDGARVIVAQAVVLDPPASVPLPPWPEIGSVSL